MQQLQKQQQIPIQQQIPSNLFNSKHDLLETGSDVWLYTFPSQYHPLINSSLMEIWNYYNQLDPHDDISINKLKKLVILKKTSKPKSLFFWLTVILIIYLIICVFTNSNAIFGFILYVIMSLSCIIWNIFAKRAGNLYWREFIDIAASNMSNDKKSEYFINRANQEVMSNINTGRRSIF